MGVQIWNTENIQEYLDENYNGFLLASNYEKATIKVSMKCPKGHDFEIIWSKFKTRKSKCLECSTIEHNQSEHKRFEKYVRSQGYTFFGLVENRGALVMCEKDHPPYSTRFNNFYNGSRCGECKKETLSKLKRRPYEYIKRKIESVEGFTLLSKTYKNNKEPLAVKCPKGHIYQTNYDNFTQGKRCPNCSGNTKHSYDFILSEVEKIEYILLTKEYKNSSIPLEMICNKGHEIKMSYDSLRRGSRCGECRYIKQSGEGHWKWNGGKVSLAHSLRSSTTLWRRKVLEETNGVCDVTGTKGVLEVHHKYPFTKIIDDALQFLCLERKDYLKDYSIKDQKRILKKVKEIHLSHKDIGVAMREDVHCLFHTVFGFFSNTIEQYELFKSNYEDIRDGQWNYSGM